VLGVRRVAAGALVTTAHRVEFFEHVVFACHSDQALRLLGAQATPDETRLLGAIRYQHNRAVLHTDASLLPKRRSAWAAWNFEASGAGGETGVCLHYLLNRLQPLPWRQAVIVSLNPLREPRAETVLGQFDVEHPIFDVGAIAAQRQLGDIQGKLRTWYCGAWTGHGFHEDGLSSGLAVAQTLLGTQAAAGIDADMNTQRGAA
jgi:predicted NAD/FAD-binding protein